MEDPQIKITFQIIQRYDIQRQSLLTEINSIIELKLKKVNSYNNIYKELK